MAGLPRPASALAGKKQPMRPPATRPTAARAHSTMPSTTTSHRMGAASPAESVMSAPPASPKKTGGIKRKEREYDPDAGQETNINVVVRCRGRNDREVRENSGVVVSTDGVRGANVDLSMGPSALSNKTYHFDKVFSPAADQSMIYDDVVAPILDEMLQGFNCTIFAYGQTGTGKTYTMSGDMSDSLGLISDSAGIIPRVLYSLFRKLEADESETSVKCSFIELYNEELRDLLSLDDNIKLKIYEDGQKKGQTATMVQGMEEAYIKTAGDGIKILQDGSHKRQVAATKCNDLSSRSHTVFTVTAYVKRTTESGEDFVSAGKLNLVDLAGSENIQRSGAENKRAAEAGLINKSLLTLGRVINALVERGSHIPYRESKLTRLLQDSLGGRTKTCIIATISPAKSNLEETISTLDYAFRAKNIRNKPQVNQMISKKTLLREFTSEIEKLKSELIATRQRNGVYLTAEGYDEILGASESRRILSEEQAQRIETMEISLRNKVQELFTLTNTFMTLKKDNDLSRQTLDETRSILEKTDMVLSHTKDSLAEETAMRQAHQRTEAELTQIGGELLSTLSQTTRDITGLHSKIERTSDLDVTNRKSWEESLGNITQVTEMVESRLCDFQQNHKELAHSLAGRMTAFVTEELQELGSTQNLLKERVASFQASEAEVVQQTVSAKDEMNSVMEEIKSLREDVKSKVGEGLKGLSAAAGRISAGVINELGAFHTQLHTSYSSLGKDFKGIFEELVKHINSQKVEVENLRSQMSRSVDLANQEEEAISRRLEACLQGERAQASEDRRQLLAQISGLITASGETQDARWKSKIDTVQADLAASKSSLQNAEKVYSNGTAAWTQKETAMVEEVLQSRETLKTKMKEDWKAINEHNISIQSTTKSVHQETIRIVDGQIEDMAKQMQALDDFVTRARSQNELHHKTHIETLKSLASNVDQSYSSIGKHCATTYDRVREVGSDISSRSTAIQNSLPSLDSNAKHPLANLRTQISQAPLQEYIPTGQTPPRITYQYPKSLPRTQSQPRLLNLQEPVVSDVSPSKSPSKPMVYNDAADAQDPDTHHQTSPVPKSSEPIGLREISHNVSAVFNRNHSEPGLLQVSGNPKTDMESVGMGPPPLKRQATESRLPTKFGSSRAASGAVRLEGRENMSAGRRLRSSPTDG